MCNDANKSISPKSTLFDSDFYDFYACFERPFMEHRKKKVKSESEKLKTCNRLLCVHRRTPKTAGKIDEIFISTFPQISFVRKAFCEISLDDVREGVFGVK